MTATEPEAPPEEGQQRSLAPATARNLATTTKTEPQMQGVSSRWLLRMLEWVDVSGGTYRVNRRRNYAIGDGRLTFTTMDSVVRVVPIELSELPPLRGFDDESVLDALADRCEQRQVAAGEVVAEFGHPVDEVLLVVHGKVTKVGQGRYDDTAVLGSATDGDFLGAHALADQDGIWEFTVTSAAPTTLLALPVSAFEEIREQSSVLTEHLTAYRGSAQPAQTKHGEAEVSLASGHEGEPDLPRTYVDYESAPREYPLHVAQTVLRVHTRVADLFRDPMDQVEQQLRLTVEALREREEYELVNNRQFGLLHNVHSKQRFQTRGGPPTPDDLDELLTRRRKTRLFLAHPRTIAAFGQECSRRGIYPQQAQVDGAQVRAWRGVPFLPCDKIPITADNTSQILAMRLGLENQGVIGLRPACLPDEHEPGLNVRYMGIDEKAIISYLVSAYHSAAVLVPDALGVLENVELGR